MLSTLAFYSNDLSSNISISGTMIYQKDESKQKVPYGVLQFSNVGHKLSFCMTRQDKIWKDPL